MSIPRRGDPSNPLHGTLTANTVADVDLGGQPDAIAVTHKGNVSDPLYFSVGGATPSAPTSSPELGYWVPAGTRRVLDFDSDRSGGSDHVKLISSGAVAYEIER